MIELLITQKQQDPRRNLTSRPNTSVMKILSWNVRGLGRPTKCHLVKNVILSSWADIICFQESKLQDIHRSHWRSIGGPRLDTYDLLPALGIASGIIIA